MKKIIKFSASLIALFLLGYSVKKFWQKEQNDNLVFTVQEAVHPIILNERGVVSPNNITIVQTATEGTILYLRKDGERVAKGDVIAKIDASGYDSDISELNLQLKAEELTLASNRKKLEITASSEKNLLQSRQKKYDHALLQEKYELSKPLPEELRKLEIDLELKKLDLEEAQEELKIQTNLYQKEFISKASLEPFERYHLTAIKKVEEAHLNIELTKNGISPERRVELRQIVERAKAELERSGKSMLRLVGEIEDQIKVSEQKIKELNHKMKSLVDKLNNSTCYAPIDGYVQIKKYYEWRAGGQYSLYAAGVSVRERDVIAVIINPGKMRVDLIFNEADFHKLKINLPVEVTLPAFGNKKFKGQLVRLGAIGKDRNLWLEELSGSSGVSMFNAEAEIEVGDASLHPGMSAMVELFLEEARPRLLIPRQAVNISNGKFYVKKNNQIIEIKGQYISPLHFEVREGLKAGEQLQSFSLGDSNE